jgi:hypothetical protein
MTDLSAAISSLYARETDKKWRSEQEYRTALETLAVEVFEMQQKKTGLSERSVMLMLIAMQEEARLSLAELEKRLQKIHNHNSRH